MPSFGPPQVLAQLPPVHVGLCPEHPWQALPLLPQASLALPFVQLVPLQQPPLHVSPPEHDVVHTCDELQACPGGQSPWLSHPQTPSPSHLWPCVDAAQSGVPWQPQVVPVQADPSGDDAQLSQCPGVPQLVGVPGHMPESWGGGGGASDTTSAGETASETDASTWARPESVVGGAEESVPDVASPCAPLSAGAPTSLPVVAVSPRLPSVISSRPLVLRPHAATSTPRTNASPGGGPTLDGFTGLQ